MKKILPLSKNEYQEFPIQDEEGNYFEGVIDITDEDFSALQNGTKCFNAELTGIVDYYETTEEIYENALHAKEERIVELKRLLSDTDYKAIKYAEGALTDAEYESTKLQRQAWRAEINMLEEQLKVNA